MVERVHVKPSDIIIVTGGAGFIGSNFVSRWIAETGGKVVNVDKLTYAGNLNNLTQLGDDPRHTLVTEDIADRPAMARLLLGYKPRAIVNFAAESHVDRSIHAPEGFIRSNVLGLFSLLEEARAQFAEMGARERSGFRFVQVSTDEVYGSLDPKATAFTEEAALRPGNPYAASKAAGDLLARAYHKTYGLPVITINASNNYGPYQYPEKLIPLTILNALREKEIPLYGDGSQLRDWLYVRDHCVAIGEILEKGRVGENYNICSGEERTNLETVTMVCKELDGIRPRMNGRSYRELIGFVEDRPGHDHRYAIDGRKIARDLGWSPGVNFEDGIKQTVRWYLDHQDWVREVTAQARYQNWLKTNYDGRA